MMDEDYSLGPSGCLWLVGLAIVAVVLFGALVGLCVGSASLVASWIGG